MEIKDYNVSGTYPHKVNEHIVNVKWSAKREVDDRREKPYTYEAIVSIGNGKQATTIRIVEADPKEAHRKVEERVNRYFLEQEK